MPEPAVRIVAGASSPDLVAEVARMHRSEVSEGFLASLGEPVLRMLYGHVTSSRLCGLFVAYEGAAEGRPLGYICGTVDTAALYREFMLQRWWTAAPLMMPKLVSPRRILRVIETLRYPGSTPADLPRAEIINFVVLPAARGASVATALFESLMRWFEAESSTAVRIVTGEQQIRAHGFYEKVGAELRGRTSIHRGSSSRIYVYSLGTRRHQGSRPTGRP